MSVLTWDSNPLPIKARLGLVPFSPLDNYIVAHFVDCVNTFFMFFYVFLSRGIFDASIAGFEPLASIGLSTCNLIPLTLIIISDEGEKVKRFLKVIFLTRACPGDRKRMFNFCTKEKGLSPSMQYV